MKLEDVKIGMKVYPTQEYLDGKGSWEDPDDSFTLETELTVKAVIGKTIDIEFGNANCLREWSLGSDCIRPKYKKKQIIMVVS